MYQVDICESTDIAGIEQWAECIKQAIACKQLLQAKAQARLAKGLAQAIA